MTELLPLRESHQRVMLTVDDFLMLEGAGAFAHHKKTELIEGDIFFVNAQHRPHARIKSRLFRLLSEALDDTGLEAIVEGSVGIPPHNVPEPDIIVIDDPDGEGLIPLASVKLVVEVADATLGFDMKRKLAIYARAGVPEYWVVDVNAEVIRQMWRPEAAAYAESRAVAFGAPIEAATVAGLKVETATL